MAAQNTTGVWP